MTVAMLMRNTVDVAWKQLKQRVSRAWNIRQAKHFVDHFLRILFLLTIYTSKFCVKLFGQSNFGLLMIIMFHKFKS